MQAHLQKQPVGFLWQLIHLLTRLIIYRRLWINLQFAQAICSNLFFQHMSHLQGQIFVSFRVEITVPRCRGYSWLPVNSKKIHSAGWTLVWLHTIDPDAAENYVAALDRYLVRAGKEVKQTLMLSAKLRMSNERMAITPWQGISHPFLPLHLRIRLLKMFSWLYDEWKAGELHDGNQQQNCKVHIIFSWLCSFAMWLDYLLNKVMLIYLFMDPLWTPHLSSVLERPLFRASFVRALLTIEWNC